MNKAWLQLILSSKKQRTKESIVLSDSLNSTSITARKLSYEHLHFPLAEDIYEMPNESLETLNSLCKRNKFVKNCMINWDRWDKNT